MLIRRVAMVAVALFIGIPLTVRVTDAVTRPRLSPSRAHLFQVLQDSDRADQFAASLTARLRAVYPKTVAKDNGERGHAGTYMFTVHSPQRISPDQIRTALSDQYLVCPLTATKPVDC